MTLRTEQAQADIDAILALRNSGVGPAEISRNLGFPVGKVAGIIYRAKDKSRNSNGGGIFTAAEASVIRRMAATGRRVVDAAEAIGRTAKSVSRFAVRHNIKFNPVRLLKPKPAPVRVMKRFAFGATSLPTQKPYVERGLFNQEIPGMKPLHKRTGCAFPCFHDGKQQLFCNATRHELSPYCLRHGAVMMNKTPRRT